MFFGHLDSFFYLFHSKCRVGCAGHRCEKVSCLQKQKAGIAGLTYCADHSFDYRGRFSPQSGSYYLLGCVFSSQFAADLLVLRFGLVHGGVFLLRGLPDFLRLLDGLGRLRLASPSESRQGDKNNYEHSLHI